jgi:putative endonuclease
LDRFVYIVECSDGTLYTGYSKDYERRIAAHNAGRGAKYTRTRRPVRLVFLQAVATVSAALKREAEIKRMSRPEKVALCVRWGAT